MTKMARAGRETVLWIGGALGALCLASLVAGWLFNVTPLVFASGSMSPSYDAGALGLAHEVPASDLAVGDVVSVLDAEGARVTHRIVEIDPQGSAVQLTLRGDTNNTVDVDQYTVTSADRVVAGVPYAGYALNAAASPFGMAVGALMVVGMLYLGFGTRPGAGTGSAVPGSRRTRIMVPAGLVSVVALGGVVGLAGQAPWAFTSAYWSDSATASTTATTPAPVTHKQPTCTSNENSQPRQPAVLTWTAVGSQYEYYWELRRSGQVAAVSSGTIGAGASPPTVISLSVPIISGGGQNDSYDMIVQTRLVSGHTNVGSPTSTPLHTGPRPNGPNWAAYCGY